MAVKQIPPRPGSPESATLVVLQAYDGTTTQCSPPQIAGNTPLGTEEDTSPVDSPCHSDFRLSAISCSSTVNLVPPRSDRGSRGEFRESPFRWIHPSLPDISVHEHETGSEDVTNKGKKPAMQIWEGWKIVLFCSWLNVLLLLIPVSWVLSSVMGKDHKLVFIFCILSMIPLVKVFSYFTISVLESWRSGLAEQRLVFLMQACVELVIAIAALRKCELRVVQSSLIGSMLSKLLLILGMCFFAGGLRFSEQGLDQTATQIHSSLLSISVGALLLPAAYHFALSGAHESSSVQQRKDILKMSHGVSIVLLFIYVFYLVFQFWSHRHLYKDTKQKSNRLSVKIPINPRFIPQRRLFGRETMKTSRSDSESLHLRSSTNMGSKTGSLPGMPSRQFTFRSPSETTLTTSSFNMPVNPEKPADAHPTIRLVTQALKDYGNGGSSSSSELSLPESRRQSVDEVLATNEDDHRSMPEPASTDALPPTGQGSTLSDESFKEPKLSIALTLFLLTVVTILATFNAEELVESMDAMSTSISKQWIGLILLPAVSSIAECVTAMNVSVKDQLGLSVSVAVGSAIQITLLIIPFMVTLGWGINKPLALLFDPFESVVLYISVQTMSHVVADGKSNWLDGAILISLYVIIAVSFWYYPGQPSEVAVCIVNVGT